MGCNTRFLAPGTISTARDPHGNLEVDKTREFCHFWPFSWAIAHVFFAPGTISPARDPWYTVILKSSKLVNFVISVCFHGL